MSSFEISTRTTEEEERGAKTNHGPHLSRTDSDSAARISNNKQIDNQHTYTISISPQDDKDLFSDVDSSDDEADISRVQQQQAQHQQQSLVTTSSVTIASNNHDTSMNDPLESETQLTQRKQVNSAPKQMSRGPFSKAVMTHPNGQKNNSKPSCKSASTSISPVTHQKTQPASKKKPRRKLTLTNSRKQRMKLIAKKSILELQRLQSHTAPNQEIKCMKSGYWVRDLEKFHYENGNFVSCSKIPTIFMKNTSKIHAKEPSKEIPSSDFPLRSGKQFSHQSSWTDDEGVICCLKELGWVSNPKLQELALNENEQVLQLSMKRIRAVVNRAKDRLPVYEQSAVFDPIVLGRIEEEILLQKIQHDIDVIASVQSSCYTSDDISTIEDTCFDMSTSLDDEHNDICSNSTSHQDLEGTSTSGPNPLELSKERTQLHDLTQQADAPVKLCRITKYFPKYVGDSSELLITEQMLAYFSRPKLKITLKEHLEESETSLIIFCGSKDDIDSVLKSIITVMQKKIIHYNSNYLLSHEAKLELDVKFDITQELGIKTVKAKKCIWIQNVVKGGQFEQIFGKKLQGGAVIVSMGLLKNGTLEPICSNKDKNGFLGQAKAKFEKGHHDSDKWIVVRICLIKDANVDFHGLLLRSNHLVEHCNSHPGPNGNSKIVALNNKTFENKAKESTEIAKSGFPSKKRKQPSPTSQNSPSTPTELQSRKRLDFKDKNTGSKGMTDKDASYKHFRDKTQPVREIEFKKRMNGHAACGSMWMQHKKIFGEHCDGNCNCVAEMEKLVTNILPEGKPFDSTDKVGFADSFCPRFFDKVQNYFPKDSAEKVLSKLVDMWKLGHVKQRTLGGTCDSSCTCGKLWSLLFLPICRGDLPQKSDMKLSRTSSNEETSEENVCFDITFRPSRSSLGFYCETHICPNSRQQVVVRSVDPGMKTVSKVLPGTVIESYTLGKQTVKVSTHQQLERVYNILKTRGDNSPVTVRFKMSKVINKEGPFDCSRDWSETNSWIGGGSFSQGWAGGAMVIKNKQGQMVGISAKDCATALKHREKSLPQSAKDAIRKVMKGSCDTALNIHDQKVPSVQESNCHKVTKGDESKKDSVSNSVPSLKKNIRSIGSHTNCSRPANRVPKYPLKPTVGLQPTKSILHKEKRNLQNKQRVTFDLSKNVVNTYTPDSNITIEPEAKGVKFTEEKLTEAIMCGQHLERFVDMLKHCVHDFKYETPLKTLTNRIKELNEEKDNLEKEGLSTDEMSERRRDIERDLYQFEMKKKIIKIYAKAHQILRTIGNSTPDVIRVGIIEHLESHSVEITKQISTLYDWLLRFRDEASQTGIKLDIDANVDVYGVSLVHAAVFVGDSNLLQTLLQGGAQMKNSKSLGTPQELSQFLLNQALMKGNLTWTKKFMKVISVLENTRTPI